MTDPMPQAATADNTAFDLTLGSKDTDALATAAAENEITVALPDQPAVEHLAPLEDPTHQPTETPALEFGQTEDEFDPALTALTLAVDADDRQTGAVTPGVPAVTTPALSAPPMPQAAIADNTAFDLTLGSKDTDAMATAAAENETTVALPDQPAVEHLAPLEDPTHQPTETPALEFEQTEDEFDPALTALAPAADADDRQTGAVTPGVPAVTDPVLPEPLPPQPDEPPTIEFELDEEEFDAAMNAMALAQKPQRREAGRHQDGYDLNCAIEGDQLRFTASVGSLTWQTRVPAHAIALNGNVNSFSTSRDRIQALATLDLVQAYTRKAQRARDAGSLPKQTSKEQFLPSFEAFLVRIGELTAVNHQPQPQPEKPAHKQANRISFAFHRDTLELKIAAGAFRLSMPAAATSCHAAIALPTGGASYFDAHVAGQLALALEYVRPFAEDNSGQIVQRAISIADGTVRGGSHSAISRVHADCLAGLAFNLATDAAKPLSRLIGKLAGFHFATDGEYAFFDGPAMQISILLAAQPFIAVDAIFSEYSAKGSCASVAPISLTSAIAKVELAARPGVPAPNVLIHLSWCQSGGQKVMMVESVEPAGIGRTCIEMHARSDIASETLPSGRSRAKQLRSAMRGMRADRWFDLTLTDGALMLAFEIDGLEIQHALSYGAYDGPGPIRPLPAAFLDRIFSTEPGPAGRSNHIEHAEREYGSQLTSQAAPVEGAPDAAEGLVADLAGDGAALEGMGAEPAVDTVVLGLKIDGPAAAELNADCASAGSASLALDHPTAHLEVAAPDAADMTIDMADRIEADDDVASEDAGQLRDELLGKHGGAATIDAGGRGRS